MEHTRYATCQTHGCVGQIIQCLLLSLLQTEQHDIHKIKIKQKKMCSSTPDTSNKFTSSLNLP